LNGEVGKIIIAARPVLDFEADRILLVLAAHEEERLIDAFDGANDVLLERAGKIFGLDTSVVQGALTLILQVHRQRDVRHDKCSQPQESRRLERRSKDAPRGDRRMRTLCEPAGDHRRHARIDGDALEREAT
jgi:hypothetical protein